MREPKALRGSPRKGAFRKAAIGSGLDTLSRPPNSHATVKVRNFAALPDVLRAHDAEPRAVLAAAGLDPDLFADPRTEVPYSALGRLIGAAVEATGCEAFGLMVGARMGATATGLTGLVSLNAPTVGDALRLLADGLRTSDTGAAVTLTFERADAMLGYVVTARNVDHADQIVDGAIAIALNILRELRGPAWRPREVRLTRRPPRDKTPFLKLFEAPVTFGAATAVLVFGADELDQPVRGRNPQYAEILAPLHAKALADASCDFVTAVRSAIRTQLAAGGLSRDSVCRALSLSARTLAHRLEARGFSYIRLADEAKYEAAQAYLRRGETIAETAARLGFADQSAFTRAFKGWSGTTPARWRADRL